MATFIPNLGKAKLAAVEIFKLIDSTSSIDSLAETGLKPEKVQGRVTFKNIKFAYPRRAEISVMDETSITIEPGQTVALVGESGCGMVLS